MSTVDEPTAVTLADELLDATRVQVDAARQNDWQRVAALADARDDLLARLPDALMALRGQPARERAALTLHAVGALDAEVRERAAAAAARTQDALGLLRRARPALRGYSRTASRSNAGFLDRQA